jgi:hypothetical protein
MRDGTSVRAHHGVSSQYNKSRLHDDGQACAVIHSRAMFILFVVPHLWRRSPPPTTRDCLAGGYAVPPREPAAAKTVAKS